MKISFLNILLLTISPIFLYSQNIDYQLLIELNEEIIKQDKSFFKIHNLTNNSIDNKIFIEFISHDYNPKKQDSTDIRWMFSEIKNVKKYKLEFCESGVIWYYEPEKYIKPIEIIEQEDVLNYKFRIHKFSNDELNKPLERVAIFKRDRKKIKLIEIK